MFSCNKSLNRASQEYWQNIKPASGRPMCPSMSKPDAWGVTAGHKHLIQKKGATVAEDLKAQSKELVGH